MIIMYYYSISFSKNDVIAKYKNQICHVELKATYTVDLALFI